MGFWGFGVLGKMELAALPRNRREDSHPCSSKTGMGITDDELAARQSSGLKAQQELSPVRLGLTEGNADPEDGALAIKADPERD